jgi:hypothetical protein
MGSRHRIGTYLKHCEVILPKVQCVPVHHSYINNIEQVKSYTFQGEISLSKNMRCTISTARKIKFIEISQTPYVKAKIHYISIFNQVFQRSDQYPFLIILKLFAEKLAKNPISLKTF